MPAYPGAVGATVPVNSSNSGMNLNKGDSQYVWGVLAAGATQLPVNESNVTFEEVAAGQASISVNIQPVAAGDPPPMVTIEILFDSTPGVSEIDVQEADTDADAFYIQPSAAAYKLVPSTTAPFSNRIDLNATGGKFMRLLMKTLPNDADVIAKITRLA